MTRLPPGRHLPARPGDVGQDARGDPVHEVPKHLVLHREAIDLLLKREDEQPSGWPRGPGFRLSTVNPAFNAFTVAVALARPAGEPITHEAVIVSKWALLYRPVTPIFEVAGKCDRGQELTMLGKNVVDEELKRGFGLSIKEIEPILSAGGDAAEMKFMECCHYLWKVDGVELIEPFILAVFNKLPEKSRCVLFQ